MTPQESSTHKVLKGASSQTIVTVVQGLLEVVSFSIISRLLSEEDFGYYAAMTAIAVIFSALSETGIGSAVIQRKTLDDKYINNAFTLSTLVGVVLTGLLCLFSGVLAKAVADGSMQAPLMIYSVTIFLGCFSSVDFSLLQRELKLYQLGLVRIIPQVLSTVVAIVMAIKGFGYYSILAKTVLAALLSSIMARYYVKTRYRLTIDKGTTKQIFNFSGWLMLSSLFRKFADQIDRLLMTSLFSISTLGFYSRPKDFITEISDKCGTIYDTVLFPVLSGVQDEKERIKKAYEYSLYFLNLLALVVMLILMFNSELIIRVFFGEKWMHVNTLFIILSFSVIGFFNGRTSDIYLRSLGMTKEQFFFRIAQFVVTALFILLSAKLGIEAVAIAFIIAYVTIVLAKMVVISRHIGMSFGKSIWMSVSAYQIFLVMIPLYIVLQVFLPNELWGNIVKGGIFTVTMLICFLVTPYLVGKYYKQNAYNQIIQFLREKLLHKAN